MKTRIEQIITDLKRGLLKSASEKILEFDKEEPSDLLKSLINTQYNHRLILNEVVKNHNEVELINCLLRHGADPTQCDRKFQSALSLARELGKSVFLNKLEDHEKRSIKPNDTSLIFSVKRPKYNENGVKNNSLTMFQQPSVAATAVQLLPLPPQIAQPDLAIEALLMLARPKK